MELGAGMTPVYFPRNRTECVIIPAAALTYAELRYFLHSEIISPVTVSFTLP